MLAVNVGVDHLPEEHQSAGAALSVSQTAEICLSALINWPSVCQRLTRLPFGREHGWVVIVVAQLQTLSERLAGMKNGRMRHSTAVFSEEGLSSSQR